MADTEGDKNSLVFFYVLENTTDYDYRVKEGQNILLSAKLVSKNSLAPVETYAHIDYPILVPAKKRIRILIHFSYTCPLKAKDDANPEERDKHREAVGKFVAIEWANLDGFDLLDETNRYEIIFPAGWKQSKQ
jgi:hypothetical protein